MMQPTNQELIARLDEIVSDAVLASNAMQELVGNIRIPVTAVPSVMQAARLLKRSVEHIGAAKTLLEVGQ